MDKKILGFFSKHVIFNSSIHVLAGIGIGLLLAYPVFMPHPLRWGLIFIFLAVLGHLYALSAKK